MVGLLERIGFLTAFVGWIWVVIIAFKESTRRGLLCIFLPFYICFYIFSRWSQCKIPSIFLLAGTVLFVISLAILLEEAKVAQAKQHIAVLQLALDNYAIDIGDYPSTEEGLEALWKAPDEAERWDGPYVKKPQFTDPWKNPYIYRSPSERPGYYYEIVSMGPDGKEVTEDDINSWVEEETTK